MPLRIPKRLQQSAAYHGSRQQESDIADDVGGSVVTGSGSGAIKGDVRVRGVLRLEAKLTEKDSFTVTRSMVDKIAAAAETAGEMPVILIEFMKTKNHPGGRLAVCPAYVVNAIVSHDI